MLGPRCDASTVGAGQCCYVPLGYDGGKPIGTDCAQACLEHVRVGDSDEWCSDTSGRYGNCFCGPQAVVPT